MTDITVQTKFFHFRQNNSGGYFIENDDVAQNLIVEAVNAKDAELKMLDITASHSKYCSCCGKRWSSWIDDEDGTNEPTVFGEKLDESCGSTIIYFFDGKREKINY